MSDPLSLVRQATITNAEVNFANEFYFFGSQKFHETTKTCFKRTLKADDYYYTLRDVIFFLQNNEIGVGDYRRLCAEKKIAAVVEQDKQSLKSYLLGEIDTCPQIDMTKLGSTASHQPSTNSTAPLNAINPSSSTTHDTKSASVTGNGPISTTQALPLISVQEMQEQRQRHAALIDQSIQRPSIITSVTSSTAVTSGTDGSTPANIPSIHDSIGKSGVQSLRRAHKRKLKGDGSDDVTAAVAAALSGLNSDNTGTTENQLDSQFLEADRQYLNQLRKDEIPAQTRSTVLCKSGADFSFALKLFNDHVLRPKDVPLPTSAITSGANSRQSMSGGNNTGIKTLSGKSGTYATPIIIVPAALTGVISIFNAYDLLQNTTYIPIEEKKAQGAKRESAILITRMLSNGEKREYKVIDNPSRLTESEWENRVVAVFASGQLWQFKDWHFSNPVDLFQNAVGVHLMLDGRVVENAVLGWNCRVLKINQYKRHMDAGAVNEFWMLLDEFIKHRKPWLIKPTPSPAQLQAQKNMVLNSASVISSSSGGVNGLGGKSKTSSSSSSSSSSASKHARHHSSSKSPPSSSSSSSSSTIAGSGSRDSAHKHHHHSSSSSSNSNNNNNNNSNAQAATATVV